MPEAEIHISAEESHPAGVWCRTIVRCPHRNRAGVPEQEGVRWAVVLDAQRFEGHPIWGLYQGHGLGLLERQESGLANHAGPQEVQTAEALLSDEQFGQLLRELRDDVLLMVETAISTGMRVSEIIGLKWRAVDLDRGLIRVEERYYRVDTDEPKSERSLRVLSLGFLLE